ncbi:ferric-dicitrate binding protein FerR (iron transport regulator) [Lewinella marina]|uniref:FecR protein domain-containing protein n=1 Tax=Neolewinella marina TaxID=438751 RepID=A0A2G0CJK9_9BACT|nr:FecR family protein [Neolewinella marina]NJB84672.1 ferric-dicitrate binding protein FerR (iron transport regulator) [Neolewinella marina]PHL00155.1 hypothetical protein CGL56_03700 [Neolewinella marina]
MEEPFSDDTLLARWLAGELSPAEEQELRARPDFAEYERLARAATRLSAPEYDIVKELERLRQRRQTVRKPSRPRRWLPYVAAAVAVLLAATIFLWPAPEQTILAAAGDGPRSLQLEDGTLIRLNAGSRLTYRNTDALRLARLEGEAFFAVAGNGQPFVVETELGEVRVLGTRFNVDSRGERLSVTCTEGRVGVTPALGDTTYLLTAGAAVELQAGRTPGVVAADTLLATDWLTGRSIFRSRPLAEVKAELERQYNLQITLDPGIDSTQLLTTSFPNQGPSTAALEVVFGALPDVSFRQSGRRVSVTTSR